MAYIVVNMVMTMATRASIVGVQIGFTFQDKAIRMRSAIGTIVKSPPRW